MANPRRSAFSEKRANVDYLFLKIMNQCEREVFGGPPENTREHIHTAAKALRIGNWEECANQVFAMNRVWKLIQNGEAVKAMVLNKIKEVALRVCLLTYSTHYDSISQPELCTIFAMKIVCTKIVRK